MKSDVVHQNLVLVVDDSPETLAMLNDTLESAGMSCLLALEAKQALSIAHKMLPDIVLVDALMPGIDGFELCRQFKKDRELQDIPVIFMTGLKDAQSVVDAFDAGGADYVSKPIVAAELIARMRVHIANARIRQSAQSALDRAGQFVFAVNVEGVMLWHTPQVNQLLMDFGLSDAWLTLDLPKVLGTWLAHTPSVGMGMKFSTPKGDCKLLLLGQSAPNEYLIRLLDQTGPDETLQLRDQLHLTQREADVLLWISRGKTNREIGQILAISPRTINKHLEQIFKKLEVDNRTSAAAKALAVLVR
jgi:DNA-binding NarL/FixJ family response regulator